MYLITWNQGWRKNTEEPGYSNVFSIVKYQGGDPELSIEIILHCHETAIWILIEVSCDLYVAT